MQFSETIAVKALYLFHSVDNLKKPNVNSTREQPLTTVTFQDPLDETQCPVLPLSVGQI